MRHYVVAEFRRPGSMSGRNVMDAAIGFVGWFVVNTLLWVWVLEGESGTEFINPFRLIPLLVTIVVLAALVFTRRRMALRGILAAIVVNALGLLLFVPPGPIMDQRSGRLIAMLPFYLSFFYSGL
jgi:hypothetical protein